MVAAEQYASRLVVPTSQRTHPTSWASHKDLAAKALKKLAGPHLPTSLKQLQNAVQRAHREYADAERNAATRADKHADPEGDGTRIDDEADVLEGLATQDDETPADDCEDA